jgi:uncharacterized protein (TIGR02246 family)
MGRTSLTLLKDSSGETAMHCRWVVVLTFVGLAWCWVPAALSQETAPADEVAVRAAITTELEAWAKFDAKQVAACHTENVTWQNPFGVRIHGRALMEKFLIDLFNRPGYRSATDTVPPKIIDVHILSPTTAVAWSEEKSAGQIDDVTGKPMAPRYSHYLEVLVKDKGAWLISDSMIMDEYPRGK